MIQQSSANFQFRNIYKRSMCSVSEQQESSPAKLDDFCEFTYTTIKQNPSKDLQESTIVPEDVLKT